MLIGVDHGNKQIKTVHCNPFVSGLKQSVTRPFGQNVLRYQNTYYTLSTERIPYRKDKTEDDRFFILTLFALAGEIEARGAYSSEVQRSPGDTDSFEPGAAFIHRPSGTGEVHEQQGYRSSDDGGDSGDGKDLGVYILHDLFGLGPYICCRISRLTEHHGHHHTQEGAVSHFGQRKPALGLGIRLLKLRSLRGFRFLQFAILQF